MEVDKIYFISAVKNKYPINGHAKVLGIQENMFTNEKEYFLFFKIHGERFLKNSEIKEIGEPDTECWEYKSLLES